MSLALEKCFPASMYETRNVQVLDILSACSLWSVYTSPSTSAPRMMSNCTLRGPGDNTLWMSNSAELNDPASSNTIAVSGPTVMVPGTLSSGFSGNHQC